MEAFVCYADLVRQYFKQFFSGKKEELHNERFMTKEGTQMVDGNSFNLVQTKSVRTQSTVALASANRS